MKYRDASIEEILAGCVEHDDEAAWEALWPYVERVARTYIHKLTNTRESDDFPAYVLTYLHARVDTPSSPLAGILGLLREADNETGDAEATFARLLHNTIKSWIVPDFCQAHKVRVPDGITLVPLDAETNKVAQVSDNPREGYAESLVAQLVAMATGAERPMAELHYFHFLSALSDDTVSQVQAAQRGLPDTSRLLNPEMEGFEQHLQDLLARADRDNKNLIRWEVLEVLLDQSKGALMTRHSRLRNRFLEARRREEYPNAQD